MKAKRSECGDKNNAEIPTPAHALSFHQMPTALSQYFGLIDYTEGQLFKFPDGLPAFPQETRFLPIEVPDHLPLVYLQSMATPELCFIALPAKCIVKDYQVEPQPGDLARIGLTEDTVSEPAALCLALLCFEQAGAVANLRAPIVVNLKDRSAVQLIQSEDHYPVRFPLQQDGEVRSCS